MYSSSFSLKASLKHCTFSSFNIVYLCLRVYLACLVCVLRGMYVRTVGCLAAVVMHYVAQDNALCIVV